MCLHDPSSIEGLRNSNAADKDKIESASNLAAVALLAVAQL